MVKSVFMIDKRKKKAEMTFINYTGWKGDWFKNCLGSYKSNAKKKKNKNINKNE